MQDMIQLLGRHLALGNIFISGRSFPAGRRLSRGLDNITLMHFNIYHHGLIVLQPLSVKHNEAKWRECVHIKQQCLNPLQLKLTGFYSGESKGEEGSI